MIGHGISLFLLLGLTVPSSGSARLVGYWDLRKGLDDRRSPVSKLVRIIGSPEQKADGVHFDGNKTQGLLYGAGIRRELCLQEDWSLWVRAAFGPSIDRPLADHDTLLSRWGRHGEYSVLLRSDHHTQTLHLFLSPDGREIVNYDSGYPVDRSRAFHDLAVVVRMGRDVTFYVDGRKRCVLRHPPPPEAVHDPVGDAPPFAIAYNSDPAPGGDHETLNGTIATVRVFSGAITPNQAAVLSGLSPQEARRTTCTIKVDTTKPIGRVHPFVLGHFFEHIQDVVYGGLYDKGSPHADADGFRIDVLAALKGLDPSVIRWPGGNYTSAYHWRWGAVPKKYRPTIYVDPVWRQIDTHAFGTPEFIEVCRRVGAEPLICVGVGRDPRCPTPTDAAAWVRYCNAKEGPEAELRAEAGYPDPFNVILWGLGNEVYGSWQIGYYRKPELYAQDIVKYARAMRTADPRIKFVICGSSCSWNRAVLTDEVAQFVNWISYHTYTQLGWHKPRLPHEVAIQSLLRIESTIEELARLNREVSRDAAGRSPITLAVDEWNEFHWDDQEYNARPENYDLAHALFTASFLNILVRHAADVTMGNYSPSVNCRGLVYADDRGVLLRSTYHVFDIYRVCAGGTAVAVDVDVPALDGCAAPILDVAAVRGKDEALNLFVVNRDPGRPASGRFVLNGFVASESSGRILTADALSAFNDFDHPKNVIANDLEVNVGGESFAFTVPARSVNLLRLKP